jgi:hypothetical protein
VPRCSLGHSGRKGYKCPQLHQVDDLTCMIGYRAMLAHLIESSLVVSVSHLPAVCLSAARSTLLVRERLQQGPSF